MPDTIPAFVEDDWSFDPTTGRVTDRNGCALAYVAALNPDRDAIGRRIAGVPGLVRALRELVSQRDAHFHTTQAWDAARAALAEYEGRGE